MLSECGGIFTAIYFIFGLLGKYLNKEFLLNKIIRYMKETLKMDSLMDMEYFLTKKDIKYM